MPPRPLELFTEIPTIKSIWVEFPAEGRIKISGNLSLGGQVVGVLPEKEAYSGMGAVYAEPFFSSFYALDPLPLKADTAEFTITYLSGTIEPLNVVLISTTGEILRVTLPSISGTKTYRIDWRGNVMEVVPPPAPSAGFPWGKVALGTGVFLALVAMVRKGRKR